MTMEQVDTELHEAVRYGDTNLVESALSDGLDPNAIGLYQWSPMHEAAFNGDLDILTLLLKSKGNPNTGDNLRGCSATHYAAKEGHVDCLQLLLDHGGRYDITNNDGETPLDMSEGKCKEILERQRTGEYISQSLRTPYSDRSTGDHHDGESQKDRYPERTDKDTPQRPGSTRSRCDSLIELSPPPRTSTPTAWDHIEVLESTDSTEAGTGLLQLSFEYNSRTSILKIRVWQVEDLLLPPVEFANINRIYVKSQILPDKKGQSKRRTEEHRLDDQDKMKNNLVTLKRKKARDSFKAIFLPCTFKFSKALEYKKITKDTVTNSTVHIDICVKQKYSTKSFSVANIQLPLRTAVRKLRKEYHQLHPCINYTMPDNIHVYDPKDLIIVTEGMYSNTIVSQPNLRALSPQNLHEEKQRRTNSDINLKAIRTQSVESIPSIIVDVPEESDVGDMLQVVAVKDDQKTPSGATFVQMNEVLLPGSTDEELEEVKVVKPKRKISRSTHDVSGSNSISETSFTSHRSANVTRPSSPSSKHELEEVKVVKPRHKLSHSTPDVTVVDINDSVTETSFASQKFSKLKLARPLSKSNQNLEIKVESLSIDTQSMKSRLKGATVKQAADELQRVTIDTPKRTRKDQVAVIELDELDKLNSNQRRSKRPTSPTNKLSIPEIVIIDSQSSTGDQASFATADTTQQILQKNLYQKRSQKPEAPRPGRAVDLRLQNEQEHTKATTLSERRSRKMDLSHEEELSIGAKSVLKNDTVAHFKEVQELKSKYDAVGAKVTSRSEIKKDVPESDRQYASQHDRMKPPRSHASSRIKQQQFPEPLTHGMMCTEITQPLPQFSDDCRTNASHVHFESETKDKSPSRTTSNFKQKEQVIKRPSQKVSSSEADIELTELVVNPAAMATPEFKLKAFQRTAKDPHPSTPFLHKSESKVGLDDTDLERMDPFYVAGTPLQSPVSQQGSPHRIRSSAHVKSLRDQSPTSRVKLSGTGHMDMPRNMSPIRAQSPPSDKTRVHAKAKDGPRSPVRNRSPSPGQRVWTSSTSGSSQTAGMPEVESPMENGSKRKARSRSPGSGSNRIIVSSDDAENNNTSQDDDKRSINPIPNPVVTRLKQSWL
ncbi:uncharacterized protein [Amphiura filiformis]|uniref:uncharacterized protein n=1 Tax=Amphiura filiformis TaxID=82378 RepID=UPI003B219FD3